MKKIIAGLTLSLITSVSYAETFNCTGYIDGKIAGETKKINADKKAVAEVKAASRLKKAGIKFDYVDCQ
ncbi:MAG: hypothetical protein RQ733_07085 [Methyloprofundus sp.]|nr:hypothetical protein [Methyloprofundus sp.]MDF1583931.1 hypothetical protein [Methyloprofundus sp.]MDT8425722.1 hypothetical protein [Methyloprofundus sp.]